MKVLLIYPLAVLLLHQTRHTDADKTNATTISDSLRHPSTIREEEDSEVLIWAKELMPKSPPSHLLGITPSPAKAATMPPVINLNRGKKQGVLLTHEVSRRLGGEQCLNDINYRYEENNTQSCQWLRNHEVSRQTLCTDLTVVTNCPQSCGCCADIDGDSFRYKQINNKYEQGCSWIYGRPSVRQPRYCKRSDNSTDQLIEDYCPKACGISQTIVANIACPSQSTSKLHALNTLPSSSSTPSDMPSDIPSAHPLLDPSGPTSDTPSASPSSTPSATSSGSPKVVVRMTNPSDAPSAFYKLVMITIMVVFILFRITKGN